MRKLAAEDVAEDLGVAVGVGGEAGLGGHAVFVQDAEAAERLKGRVVVASKGDWEGVRGSERWN